MLLIELKWRIMMEKLKRVFVSIFLSNDSYVNILSEDHVLRVEIITLLNVQVFITFKTSAHIP